MLWKEFAKKWRLQQIKKPGTQIISNTPRFVFGAESAINIYVDPQSWTWSDEWNNAVKKAFEMKMDEFMSDYKSLEDFVKWAKN